MPILEYNISWMLFNSFLAVLAVVFGYYFIKISNRPLKIFFGILWILFLPNTIYMFTDLMHLIHQWNRVELSARPFLLLQYVLLEVVAFATFVLAFRPFERIIEHVKLHKNRQAIVIIVFNFLIAFGMVLGRIERINSWEVFTEIGKVIDAVVQSLTSPAHLGLTLLFGLVCNFSYFLFRDPIYRSAIKLRKSLAR